MDNNYWSGIWVGQIVDTTCGTKQSLKWSLSLISNSVSAIGSTCSVNPDILHGTWDPQNFQISLTQTSLSNPLRIIVYLGTVKQIADNIVIHGTFEETDNNTKKSNGGFYCALKTDDSGSLGYLSGFWIGEAAPDDSLSAFMIPTNPIFWNLTIPLNPANKDENYVFGSGYFNDAADIPNHPALLFSLYGNAVSGNGSDGVQTTVHITKAYEEATETAGYTVNFNGQLTYKNDKWSLSGTWDNPKGGSFGTFTCLKLNPHTTQSHVCLCSVCGESINGGTTCWSCVTCKPSWTCCSRCYSDGVHAHKLIPEMTFIHEGAEGKCCAELVLDAFQRFSVRPFLGIRPNSSSPSGFTWMTYGEASKYVHYLAEALIATGIKPNQNCLLISDLSQSYAIALLGGLLAGCVLVPVHGVQDISSLTHVLKETQPAVCIVGYEYHQKYKDALQAAAISPVIQVTIPQHFQFPVDDNHSDEKENIGVQQQLTSEMDLGDILKIGSQLHKQKKEEVPKQLHFNRDLSSTAAILYTSGSTGAPKGVVYREELVLPSGGVPNVYFVFLDFQKFHPSFLPSLISTMQCGGYRCIATNLGTLLDDIKLARPTHVSAPPVFFNMIHREYISTLVKEMAAISSTSASSRENMHNVKKQLEEKVAKDIRALLGNRLISMNSGGAPIARQVADFFSQKLGITVPDLYGCREAGPIAKDGIVYDSVEVKLLPVPELDLDPQKMDPPRGEIAVHSNRLISGYFMNQTMTDSCFVTLTNGKRYYKTGDIGELTIRQGKQHVRIVDRSSTVTKLAHGDWFAPSKVEALLEDCPWVHQAFVVGGPEYCYPVAVIVPSNMLFEYCEKNTMDPVDKLKHEIYFWCNHYHLRPHEIPRAIAIEHNPWTPENGGLTSTHKKRRHVLITQYNHISTTLLQTVNKLATLDHQSAPQEMSSTSLSSSLSPEFLAILAQVLPDVSERTTPHMMLAEIGGDSMAAARLVHLMNVYLQQNSENEKNRIGVEMVFEYSLGHLDALFTLQSQSSSSSGSWLVTVPELVNQTINWSEECGLPSILSDSLISPPVNPRSTGEGDVLITGCTGFLGPYLVAEVLKAYPSSVKVYCIVRGKSNDVARQRLLNYLPHLNPSDLQRLCVFSGDLEKSQFGMRNEEWDQLTNLISDIYHSGALVNMAMPYTALRHANVGGTLTVIRLALRAKARVHYVSSVSAMPKVQNLEEEQEWLPSQLDDISPLDSKGSYGATKYVSEVLLQKAAKNYGLEIRIIRPSVISSDSSSGLSNLKDFTNILLSTCVTLGAVVAPTSYNLCWIPVDFVAQAIVALGRCSKTVGHTFHLCGDGPLLSDVIHELQKKGYSIDNISSDQWKLMVENLPSGHPATVLKSTLQDMDFVSRNQVIPTEKTRRMLDEVGVMWPKITPVVIGLGIDFLAKNNFLVQKEVK